MNKIIFALLLTAGLSTQAAENTKTTSTTTTTTTTSTTANDTPSAACKSMVENAKNKNFDAFMKMTTDMPAHKNMKATKNTYQKTQGQYLDRLQDLSCGNEVIAQDHAVVESESKGEKRLVPFVKVGDGWKFDMKTYQSFYHTEEHGQGKAKM